MANHQERNLNQRRRAATNALIQRMGPENGRNLALHLEHSRNQGHKEASIYSVASAVVLADEVLKGRDFRTANADDLLGVTSALREYYSPASLRTRIVSVRGHLRWLWQQDPNYDDDRLPRALERALHVKRPREVVVGQVIPETDFQALLAAIPARNSMSPPFPMEVRDRCFWTMLRASGFRISEQCSLQVGDVKMEGGQARIALRRDAAELKTGPRTIFIQAGVKELQAWLSVHPWQTNPKAPLFPCGDNGHAMDAGRARCLLHAMAKKADLEIHKRQKLTPHDFRHTCATEKARLGWNEAQLCAYFGWSSGSRTPGTYVHLSLDDMRARIAQDADRKPGSAADMTTAIADALRRLMQLDQGAASAA